jgi:predicted O-methyltransferase YrrM
MRKLYFYFIAILFLSFSEASEIAVLTMAIGKEYASCVQLAIQNKQAYCQSHGYDFYCLDHCLDEARPAAWNKILFIQEILKNNNYQWVFWTDADSLIMNLATPLESFLDERYNLIITRDKNGVNSGQFFIKSCPWSLALLNDVYAHDEFKEHPWWENQALVSELAQREDYRCLTKIVPQRMFNSYASEIQGSDPSVTFQTGDFIIHFAGVRNERKLKSLLRFYNHYVINEPMMISLDRYLCMNGYTLTHLHSNLNEGYMTSPQKKQFMKELKKHGGIKRIAEIGLNAGHSAEMFFHSCPGLEAFFSFDLNEHPYTNVAVEYFQNKYRGRFVFIEGDSSTTVPAFAKSHAVLCDLIYIDGGHTYESCLHDIMNCKLLAHPKTILWVDDTQSPEVRQALDECVKKKIIRIVKEHSSLSEEGGRYWTQAKYCL